MIKPDTLPQFLRNKVEENDAFGLVEGLCQLLRSSPTEKISPTLHLFKFILKNDKELGCSVSKLLCGWLCGLRLYPLFISSGILTRGGFGQEMKTRIYERFNPSFKDINDLRDIFYLLFSDKNDARWIDAVPLKTWRGVFGVLT
ncbi:MAG: recombinase, partial [Haemophilus parainfluenzae]|nr:recombinase [Haemophilus parainfluenzae]